MVKFKKNYLRDEWESKVIEWLDRNAVENKKYCLCPRCGLRVNENSECNFSQYYPEYIICANCFYDEILRDSVGREQADISKWYMNTNKKMSYMME